MLPPHTVLLLVLCGSLHTLRLHADQDDNLTNKTQRSQLEKRWLATLEMDSPPVIRRAQPVPDYMRTIYNHLDYADNDESGELSAQFKGPEPKKRIQNIVGISPTNLNVSQSHILMAFDVSEDARFKDPSRVELVLVHRPLTLASSFRHVRARVGFCLHALHCVPPKQRIQHRPLNSSTQTFEAFDITDAYSHWQVKLEEGGERFLVLFQMRRGTTDLYDPDGEVQLVLYHNFRRDLLWPSTPPPLNPHLEGRSRRSIPTESDPNELCHLDPWYFDFSRMGWDTWVLTPTGFGAGICVGLCPEPLLNTSVTFTNYAGIKSLFRTRGFADSLDPPAACCVPLRMTAVSLLVQRTESVVEVKHLNEMKTTDCACL